MGMAAAVGLPILGGLIGAKGAYDSGVAGQYAAQYQAQVARNNQVIAEQNATYAEQKGQAEEGVAREGTAQLMAGQRADFAAGGIDANSGSALRVQQDTARLGEIDALTVRNNAAREAYDWRVKGANMASEAVLDEFAGRESRRAGTVGAWTSILGGASSTADRWNKYKG